MIATKISNCSSFMYYKTEPQPILCKDSAVYLQSLPNRSLSYAKLIQRTHYTKQKGKRLLYLPENV